VRCQCIAGLWPTGLMLSRAGGLQPVSCGDTTGTSSRSTGVWSYSLKRLNLGCNPQCRRRGPQNNGRMRCQVSLGTGSPRSTSCPTGSVFTRPAFGDALSDRFGFDDGATIIETAFKQRHCHLHRRELWKPLPGWSHLQAKACLLGWIKQFLSGGHLCCSFRWQRWESWRAYEPAHLMMRLK